MVGRSLPLLLLAFLAVGCSPCRDVETKLFFGRDIEGRATVSESDWEGFLAREVLPRLPGFTALDATGYAPKEPSKLLIHLHDGSAAPALDAIVEAHKRAFRQQSVLRVDSAACMRFQ